MKIEKKGKKIRFLLGGKPSEKISAPSKVKN